MKFKVGEFVTPTDKGLGLHLIPNENYVVLEVDGDIIRIRGNFQNGGNDKIFYDDYRLRSNEPELFHQSLEELVK